MGDIIIYTTAKIKETRMWEKSLSRFSFLYMNIILSERTAKNLQMTTAPSGGWGLQLWIHWTCQPLWVNNMCAYMGVSENSGNRKSSIFIRFSIINHPFWGTTIFGNAHIATSHNRQIIPKRRFGMLSEWNPFKVFLLQEMEVGWIWTNFTQIPSTACVFFHQMGVSKNRGTPKWMVYNGKPY